MQVFLSLAEAAKNYPCIQEAWVEFLGEPPGEEAHRVDATAPATLKAGARCHDGFGRLRWARRGHRGRALATHDALEHAKRDWAAVAPPSVTNSTFE